MLRVLKNMTMCSRKALCGSVGNRFAKSRLLCVAIACGMVMCGCAPVGNNFSSAGIASGNMPSRVVTQIINNTCGDSDAAPAEESLSSGQVKGLSKVKDGFGIPYDEHADNYVNPPVPVTDDSYEANKERGIGYAGYEAHLKDTLKDGPGSHDDNDIALEYNEPGTPFGGMLTPEEEKYGCCMRWEYSALNANGGISGYYDFLTGNGTGQMQYVAIHSLKTDKWCICCPYDYGPGHNLPTAGGGKYANGRIGGVTPAVSKVLGFQEEGGCPDNALTEWWWVENSDQVKCGEVSDLSQFEQGSSRAGQDDTAKVASAIVSTVATSTLEEIASNTGAGGATGVTVVAANPSSFVNRQNPTYRHGTLPKESVRYIVLQDTNLSTDDAEGAERRASEFGLDWMPHFMIDRQGTITQFVPLDGIAHHAGASTVAGANDAFGLTQERDDNSSTEYDHAMDAWSIGIALVHERTDDGYQNTQLNALDRLISYIDQETGNAPAIITKGAWRNSDNPLSEEPSQSTTETGAGLSPDDALIEDVAATVVARSGGKESSTAIESARAGSSVTGDFPVSEYQSSRNHSNVKTVADVAKARENSECSDDAAEDADMGPAIAAKAVDISGSASPDEPIYGGWDELPTSPKLSKYVSEKNKAYPGVPGWADCGRCAATAVKASGADEDFPAHMDTAYQYQYMTSSSKWKRVGTMRTGDRPDSMCKPGDVLVTEGKGHIMIYVGNDAVKKKYPSSDANFFEGSMGKYYGWCYSRSVSSCSKNYAIFRCVQPDGSDDESATATGARAVIVDYCRKNVGASYDWTPSGGVEGVSYNCSYLSTCAYAAAGLSIPSWQGHQNGNGSQSDAVRNAGHWTTDPSQLKPGDLVFFGSSPDYTGHVGVSLGGNQMIDSIPDGGVQQRTLQSNFVGGGWPFADEPTTTESEKSSKKETSQSATGKPSGAEGSESFAYMEKAKEFAKDPAFHYTSQSAGQALRSPLNPNETNINCTTFVMCCLIESGTYTEEELKNWNSTVPVISPLVPDTYLPDMLAKFGWETHDLTSDDQLQYGDIIFYPAMEQTGHIGFYAGKTDGDGNQVADGEHTVLEAAPNGAPANGWMGSDVGGHHTSPVNGWHFTKFIRPPADIRKASAADDSEDGDTRFGHVNVDVTRS